MPRRPRFLAALAALACALPLALGAPLPLPAGEPLPPADPGLETALLTATNAARARFGKPALTADEGLARAAREHAHEMATLNYFSHGSPVAAHATLQKRLALAGSPLVDVAENLVLLGETAGDAADARKAVQDWLASPHHRENLLNGSYDRVGFGAARNARGQLFIVQEFGAEPVRLLAATLAPADRRVSEIAVHVVATRTTKALIGVTGAPQATHALPAGASTVTLTTDAAGSAQLIVAIASGGNRYLVDDGGPIDLRSGRYRPDPGEPRARITVTGVDVQAREEHGARLALAYAAPASTRLTLFLQGSDQPAARTSPGHFELFLPDTLGVATVSVGVDEGGGKVALIHRFHLDAAASRPQLLAGAAPNP